MTYNNLYHEVANPLFEADGVDYRRGVLPSDPDGYLPDDLVIPYESAHRLADEEPLTARDVRSALWLCAGNVTRAAKRLGIPPARIRSFARNSPWIQQEFAEARERIWRGRGRHSLGGMTILFDRVLRHRCPNDVQALIPPAYDKFPPFERLDDHREQVRAALWQFGGIITVAARYLRVEPARLRRFIREIEPSLLEDIERIDATLTEYAQAILGGRAPKIAQGSDVFYISKAKRHTA